MKSPLFSFLVIYLCVASLTAIFVTVFDKIKARRHSWRIPESTLLMFAALGGSAAMLITMLLIRHKTRHVKFMLGIPIILVFQAIVVAWLYTRFA